MVVNEQKRFPGAEGNKNGSSGQKGHTCCPTGAKKNNNVEAQVTPTKGKKRIKAK